MSKLTDAKALVDDLKQKAGEQSRQLADKQEEADAALREITASMQVNIDRSLNEEMYRAFFVLIISHL